MKAVLVAATILLPATVRAGRGEAGSLPVPAGEGRIVVENTRADKVVTLSAAELAKLPRAEVEVGKEHRKYSGVPLAELLHVAGVEWGGNCSPLLTCYVLVEGADGYRVLFSIPEIDPEQRHKMVILADRCDGKPLSSKDGPYRDGRGRCETAWPLREAGQSNLAPGGGPPAAARPVTTTTAISMRTRRTSMKMPVRRIFCPFGFILLSMVIYPSLPAVAADPPGPHGKVYLVGMGPGDAELVTFKAAKALKDADCVFCFRYLKDEVARYAPPAKITVASPLLMGRVCGRNPAELPPEMREGTGTEQGGTRPVRGEGPQPGGGGQDRSLRRRGRPDGLLPLVVGHRGVRRSSAGRCAGLEFLQCGQRGTGAEHYTE